MQLNKIQLMVDISFITKQRSAKWWRGKELVPHLRQLGHDDPSTKKIKDVLTEMVNLQYLEKIRVKKQWTLYAYRFKREFTSNHGTVVQRTQEDVLW
jgi:hypothetical protein